MKNRPKLEYDGAFTDEEALVVNGGLKSLFELDENYNIIY